MAQAASKRCGELFGFSRQLGSEKEKGGGFQTFGLSSPLDERQGATQGQWSLLAEEGLRENFSLQKSDIWGEDCSLTAVALARFWQCGLTRPTLERVGFGRRGGAIPPDVKSCKRWETESAKRRKWRRQNAAFKIE